MVEASTDLGDLIERAREINRLSKREAARRAGISEGRWRQIVTGVQRVGSGIEVPARPRRETVIAMANAVGVNRDDALTAAGFDTQSDTSEPKQETAPEHRFADPRFQRIWEIDSFDVDFRLEVIAWAEARFKAAGEPYDPTGLPWHEPGAESKGA